MKISKHGFGAVEFIVVLVVLAIVTLVGYSAFRGSLPFLGHKSTTAIGPYSLWLDANQDDNFNIYYSLGLSAKQNIVPTGKSGKIKVVSLDVTNGDNSKIIVTAFAHEESWERHSCALIEPWVCDPPSLEAKTNLPKLVLKNNSKSVLILNVDGKNNNYEVTIKDYKLSINQASTPKTNSVPYYPNGIANAIAVNKIKNSLCEDLNSSQITQLLRGNNEVKLAAETYPGIENVRPKDVLVEAKAKRFNDDVTPPDINGCVIRLIHANLK
jgi:prepilin-type N-terminal cleavage/methylation domain-containing protein